MKMPFTEKGGQGGFSTLPSHGDPHHMTDGFMQQQRASPDSGLCTPESEAHSPFNEKDQQPVPGIGGFSNWHTAKSQNILSSRNDRSQSSDSPALVLPSAQLGRQSSNPVPSAVLECVCNRPKALVACQRCGFESEGRVQKTCPRHPNRKALMDLVSCPKCRSTSCLKELRV